MRLPTVALLVALFGLAGCPPTKNGPSNGRPPVARDVDPDMRTLVAVIDQSASIKTNDTEGYGGPGGLTTDGAQLAAALTATGNNFGSIVFSDDAESLTSLRTIRDKDTRIGLRDGIAKLSFQGQTNFMAALEETKRLLEQVGGGRGKKTVVFISDGEPTKGPDKVEDFRSILGDFKENGWRIHTIGFSSEGQSDLIQRLATDTGGAYYPVNHSRDLLLAFLQITSDAENLFTTTQLREVELFPGTRRLIYGLIKLSPHTRFSRLSVDNDNVAYGVDPNIFYYPGDQKLQEYTNFEVVHIDNPKTGVWNAEVSGPYEIAMTMAELPFDLEVHPEAPKSDYYAGDVVRLGLRASTEAGRSAEPLEILMRGATVEVTVTDETGRKVASTQCTTNGPEGNLLDFIGTTRELALRNPQSSEIFKADFTLSWSGQSNTPWQVKKSVSFRMHPTPPAFITLDPKSIASRDYWVPGRVRHDVTIATNRGGVSVVAKPSDGFRASPDRFSVAPGQPVVVSIEYAGSDKPGIFQGEVVFEASHEGQTQSHGVVIEGRMLKLEGTGDLGKAQVGSGSQWLPVAFEVVPDPGRVEEVRCTPLQSSSGGTLAAELIPEAGGGWNVRLDVGAGVAPGTYTGKIQARTRASQDSWGELPVRLEVVLPKAGLQAGAVRITCTAAGWVETTVPVTLQYIEPLAFEARKAPLRDASGTSIAAGLNMELTTETAGFTVTDDGVLTGTLAPNQPLQLKIRIYAKSDYGNGTYTGKYELRVRGKSGWEVQELPVTLEISR